MKKKYWGSYFNKMMKESKKKDSLRCEKEMQRK